MEWISVKDRLPPLHKSDFGDWYVSDLVLGTYEESVVIVYVKRYMSNDSKLEYIWNSYGTFRAYDITHWMPLPELPKEEDNPKEIYNNGKYSVVSIVE